VSDLSAVRFLSYVVLKHYPPLDEARLGALDDVEDSDWLDDLMAAVLDMLGATDAPTAEAELAVLEGGKAFGAAPADPVAMFNDAVERGASLLAGKSFSVGNARSFRANNTKGEDRLRLLISRAGGAAQPRTQSLAQLSALDRLDLVRRAFSQRTGSTIALARIDAHVSQGQVYLPGLIDFIIQLKRYRHCLVNQLTDIHRTDSGQNPLLLVPAMVDFRRWLRDEPGPESTFSAQTKVWSVISRRPGGPAVHGYVAYCPLRQVEFDRRLLGTRVQTADVDNPKDVVKTALEERGFLGVKLYPPMGFRATHNATRGPADHPMPEAVLTDVFGDTRFTDALRDSRTAELGAMLDDALDELFKYCADLGAPIMAHGGNSVAANCGTGELADPYYWKGAFNRADRPRVMLAHFGGFGYPSADPAAPDPPIGPKPASCETDARSVPFGNTWEAWLVRYMVAAPDRPVFTDLSYFSEALGDSGFNVALQNFRKFSASQLAVLREHLVFGTDWVMLAQERNVPKYSARVRAFVADVFNPDGGHPEYVDAIMRGNFLRFAQLTPGSDNFKRIARVYDGDPALTARLTAACTLKAPQQGPYVGLISRTTPAWLASRQATKAQGGKAPARDKSHTIGVTSITEDRSPSA
jgi:hypothetical protein